MDNNTNSSPEYESYSNDFNTSINDTSEEMIEMIENYLNYDAGDDSDDEEMVEFDEGVWDDVFDEVRNEEHDVEKDILIDDNIRKDLMPCVIITRINGSIQRCGNEHSLRQLRNLVGVWQVDKNAVKEADGNLSKLGVCSSHFSLDHILLHKNEKKYKEFESGLIQHRRCVSCSNYIDFFSRGTGCSTHSWTLDEKIIQVPCVGQVDCAALIECKPMLEKTLEKEIKNSRCICCKCYEELGGHLYERPGKGKSITCVKHGHHNNDINISLEFIGSWICNMAKSDNEEQKKGLLTSLLTSILPFLSERSPKKNIITVEESTTKNTLPSLPSLFTIRFYFLDIEKKLNMSKKSIFEKKINYFEFGQELGIKILNSSKEINKSGIKSPKSILEYYNAFPSFLTSFLSGMIQEIQINKLKIVNRKRSSRGKPNKTFCEKKSNKIVTFISSVLLGIAFPLLQTWLPQVLASLSRKPQLLSSLNKLLRMCQVIGHTDGHERRKAIVRMGEANPKNRLESGENLWNLAIIDNIDFKEKCFSYGNIYDVTRSTSHAILRMAFQSQINYPLRNRLDETIQLDKNTCLFGMNVETEQTLSLFHETIKELLDFQIINNEWKFNENIDSNIIKKKLLTKMNRGSLGPSPKIVIFEPGRNPNDDNDILESAKMYKEDFDISDNGFLDIVADQAIFVRLILARKKWPKIRPMLGQWHTSKDFCSVLLVLFSSYGIFNMALRLGVRFLDKFEATADYRSTARILDLLWSAIGIAINIYIKRKDIELTDIMNDDYDSKIFLKVCYLYYRWAGIWKIHRIAIRLGDHDLQKNSLAAGSPLFASAGKNRYTTAISHHLAIIASHPQLEEKLRIVGGYKIPRDVEENIESAQHICFAFDEALETFGVKFIKQNIRVNNLNQENLKLQIKASQDERDRIDLLVSEYLEDKSIVNNERAINSRRDSLWDLVNDLLMIFDMNNPLEHPIFEKFPPPQLHSQGLTNLFNCYEDGFVRINSVFCQEVLKIEKLDPTGRRTIGVIRTKVEEYEKMEKINKRKRSKGSLEKLEILVEPTQPEELLLNASLEEPSLPQCKKQRSQGGYRQTTPGELSILEQLKQYKSQLPDDVLQSVLSQLSEKWDKKRIKSWWSYWKNK
jgi:hypothetical protein